jgi:hypothetical protein
VGLYRGVFMKRRRGMSNWSEVREVVVP